jgi:Lipoprotein LpqB beta-propeller domain/Sporulation and spore germination
VPRPAASRLTPTRSRPLLTALAALVVAALAATGCVSMPSGGPVLSYPVTQGTDAQNQPFVQIQPQPPGNGWSPSQIVQGFLTASANWGTYPQIAKQYLTPAQQKTWDPLWSAVVYKFGPNPAKPKYPSTVKNPTSAVVEIQGKIQANLQGYGNYSVPSASAPGSSPARPSPFLLQKVGGQWRISSAPEELLLTSNSFANDYQLRNLYFFDPLTKVLVPDPVYVPVRAGDLMDGLVNELIAPPDDWLSQGATRTAFPPKTKVSNVKLAGVTAVVSLTGTAIGKAATGKAGPDADVMLQISAQLLSTLSGAASSGSNGQVVQAIEVVVNGTPWVPPDRQGNPVQHTTAWHPALGKSTEFYSVDSKGYLTSRTAPDGKPVSIAKIGTGYSQIAVSPDGTYLAALRGGTLYTGRLVDGSLTKRGAGFMAMSWDANDDLWASQGGQIVMFRGTSNARQPLAGMVPVSVLSAQLIGPYTALQVAPDGVRVAIVSGGNELTFGAISGQQSQNPRITLSPVQQTPLTQVQTVPQAANFTSLTWYGPDNVITLATPGPSVTEYPVSGATPTPLQAEPGMQTITASAGHPLIAGLPHGRMAFDPGLLGSWTTINNGDTPADGSSPTYPG